MFPDHQTWAKWTKSYIGRQRLAHNPCDVDFAEPRRSAQLASFYHSRLVLTPSLASALNLNMHSHQNSTSLTLAIADGRCQREPTELHGTDVSSIRFGAGVDEFVVHNSLELPLLSLATCPVISA